MTTCLPPRPGRAARERLPLVRREGTASARWRARGPAPRRPARDTLRRSLELIGALARGPRARRGPHQRREAEPLATSAGRRAWPPAVIQGRAKEVAQSGSADGSATASSSRPTASTRCAPRAARKARLGVRGCGATTSWDRRPIRRHRPSRRGRRDDPRRDPPRAGSCG